MPPVLCVCVYCIYFYYIYFVITTSINLTNIFYLFFIPGTGSTSTLQHEFLMKDLRSFFESHYNAPKMKLSIVGRESPEQLAAMAKSYFSDVPTKRTSTVDATGLYTKSRRAGPDTFSSLLKHKFPVLVQKAVSDSQKAYLFWYVKRFLFFSLFYLLSAFFALLRQYCIFIFSHSFSPLSISLSISISPPFSFQVHSECRHFPSYGAFGLHQQAPKISRQGLSSALL